MQGSKVMFSESELKLVEDRGFILTKTQIIERVYQLFGAISSGLHHRFLPLQELYPEIFSQIPKISKGENYEGFPWVMLDYPRFFDQTRGHFALRTFFWWGHYFLVQLHLSGEYLKLRERLEVNPDFLTLVKEYNLFAGQPLDPWNSTLPQQAMLSFGHNSLPSKDIRYYKIMIPVNLDRAHMLPILSEKISNVIAEIMIPQLPNR